MSKIVRRYITAAKADELRKSAAAKWMPTHAETFNIMTLETTEWYVVPDDDPRIDTYEEV